MSVIKTKQTNSSKTIKEGANRKISSARCKHCVCQVMPGLRKNGRHSVSFPYFKNCPHLSDINVGLLSSILLHSYQTITYQTAASIIWGAVEQWITPGAWCRQTQCTSCTITVKVDYTSLLLSLFYMLILKLSAMQTHLPHFDGDTCSNETAKTKYK